jgi:membrane-associated protein
VFLLALLDAVVPVVPSETAVITDGVVAGAGDLSLAMIVPAAGAGAFLGDNSAYWVGRRFGTRVVDRLFACTPTGAIRLHRKLSALTAAP